MTKTMKFIILLITVALAAASAATYDLTLFQPSVVNGTELKPGEYKITVDANKAVIAKGKEKVEVAVKVENTDSKFNSTSVRYASQDGKNKVREIRLGGTNTKLIFN
jgi:hypothetical protein